jgi:hypothetical protein
MVGYNLLIKNTSDMKKYMNKILLMLGLVALISCEREFESEGLAEGVIRFPSITLNQGASLVLVQNQDSYVELGATALLGADDISNELLIEGVEDVDISTPGVYPVTYSVTVTNELGTQSTVSQVRYVVVATEDVSTIDLSGNYIGTGFSANPATMAVTKIGDGLYSIPDVLSSTNGIGAVFAHLGGDVITIPNQATSFGDVNTTAEGASAMLTETGFIWNVYIGCCGVFGPIDFVQQ